MSRTTRRLAAAGAALAALAVGLAPAPADAATHTFTTPGEHELTIPDGVTRIHVTATGARGGAGGASSYVVNYYGYRPPLTDDFASMLAAGGFGDVVDADVTLPAGTNKLFVRVGGRGGDATDTTGPAESTGGAGGFNGGGTGGGGQAGGGGGGGASDVRLCSAADTACEGGTLASRLLVAAGGGGGGALFQLPSNAELLGGPGGHAGAAGGNGSATYYVNNVVYGGGAGTLTAGGAGGAAAASESFTGEAGTAGAGGDGTFGTGPKAGGGGGGGGYYGGGAGAGGGKGPDIGFERFGSGAGGGGGSSYVAGLTGDDLAAAITRATTAGGRVVVSWPDDATAPAVTVTAPGAPAGQGGFFGDDDVPVTVQVRATDPAGVTSLACTDNGTPVTVAGQSGSSPLTGTLELSTEGTHALACTATDALGNSGAAGGSQNTATVRIDRTAPAVTCTPPPGAGWHATEQSVPCTSSDSGGSGLGDASDASFELTTSVGAGNEDATAETGTRTVCDTAGNCAAPVGPYTFKVDRKGPAVTCDSPTPVFELGAAGERVGATVTDGGSGAVEDTVSAAADTSSVGAHTVTLTGADAAGNTTSEECSYRVAYRFDGFDRPVDNDALNDVNAGQTVPLKWRVLDADGRPVELDPSQVRVTVASLACGLGTTPDRPAEEAAGASGLRDGRFNWKTPKSYAGSCKTLSVDLGDGVPRTARFRFRR